MPRTKTRTIEPAPRKRVRRNGQQLIDDLQAEIERIRVRSATRAAKRDPALKHTSRAVRSIDLALASAANGTHKEALNEARVVLVAFLQLEGVKIPHGPGPRGAQRHTGRGEVESAAASAV